MRHRELMAEWQPNIVEGKMAKHFKDLKNLHLL
jgi:hypothetical protein